jgi:hypothetical protein
VIDLSLDGVVRHRARFILDVAPASRFVGPVLGAREEADEASPAFVDVEPVLEELRHEGRVLRWSCSHRAGGAFLGFLESMPRPGLLERL